MSPKFIYLGALLGVFLIILAVWSGNQARLERSLGNTVSLGKDNHLHGIGYDADNDRLFLATHEGLFILRGGRLERLGESSEDLMGFLLNPRDAKVIYASGHPAGGGNLGVLRSRDAGISFEQIFAGLEGEIVDFHAMAMSLVNPEVLYGFYQGDVYRTKNGGDSWELARGENLPQQGFCWGGLCLAADSRLEARVYAGTAGGFFVSDDFGDTWQLMNDGSGAVAGVGVSLHDSQIIFAFTESFGLVVSKDRGESWETKDQGLRLTPQEIVFGFAFDKNNPDRVFLGTTLNQVFVSQDSGETWQKIL